MAGWYTGRGEIEVDWILTICSLGVFLMMGGMSIDDKREDTSLGQGGENGLMCHYRERFVNICNLL